ncbi:MAG: hypothetical protein HY868_20455 [Chloroflexi bacterium]|nr:hypothetical protein [Chloroflexota bacterium]
MQPQSISPVNVFTNDPNALGLGLEQIIPPNGKSPFAIPGWTGRGGLFNPGTPEFEAGELHVVLTNTFAAWVDFFGADFQWQPRIAQLPIVPRAGKDFNAYYDRRGLKFFYNTDPKTKQVMYTCESCDVVAHECGHAILDAHHPDYWDSLLGETGAFHEAFGDMTALLVTLANPRVRAAMLAENGGDLAKSNVVSRLAEQLALGLFDSGYAESVVSANALRDAVNKFKYKDPDMLPGRAPASKLSSESHSFSRVFSGAFYDLLIAVYEQLRNANASLSPDAALAQARRDAGHLLAQGLILAPRGDAAFKTVASAMITADLQNNQGKYFAALKKTFVARRVLKASEANALKKSAGAGKTETSSLAGTASGAIGVPLAMVSTEMGGELPSNVRRELRVAKREFRLVDQQTKHNQMRVLHYAAPREVALKGKALGVAQGAVVTVTDAVAVQVDREGKVVSANQHKVDRGQEQRITDHVAKLVERNRVYAAKEGEEVDPAALIEKRQPYYVAYDAQGTKRIRRAFIACCE